MNFIHNKYPNGLLGYWSLCMWTFSIWIHKISGIIQMCSIRHSLIKYGRARIFLSAPFNVHTIRTIDAHKRQILTDKCILNNDFSCFYFSLCTSVIYVFFFIFFFEEPFFSSALVAKLNLHILSANTYFFCRAYFWRKMRHMNFIFYELKY